MSALSRVYTLAILGAVALLIWLAVPARAASVPSVRHDVPAKVFDGDPFPVSFAAPDLESVRLRFLGKNVTVKAVQSPDGSVARADTLLAMPLTHKAASEQLEWIASGVGASGRWSVSGGASVAVVRKKYPTQSLTLEPKYVTPPPELKERIDRERALMIRTLNTFSPERFWSLPLSRPVPGTLSSLFGMRRTLNGETRSTHRGLDFRAKAGDPVKAAADGRVVLTGDFYYSGNFVVVDHGLGVFTTYMHLSAIDAREGQFLRRGEVLGKVGSTGRSTGPHLHLSLNILGFGVNAQTIMEPIPAPVPAPSSPPARKP